MGWLAWRSSGRNRKGVPRPTREPLPMRAAAKPGLEVEPVDEVGKAGAQAGATTMVVAAIGEDRPTNSGEERRTTSLDHNIGEETSFTSSASCVSSAARGSISLQTA